ncbi:hypothetical protein A6R68_17844, partial [Neotoma lepida]
PQDWYLWEAKGLKELHKAVAEDGENCPWAQTLLQDITYNPCVPKDWMDLTKAVLSSTQFVNWIAHYKEECRVRAGANQAAQLAIPITYDMLTGTDNDAPSGTPSGDPGTPSGSKNLTNLK